MDEMTQRLEKLAGQVEAALGTAREGGASEVLLAVVEEFGRKVDKARRTVADGGDAREAVVEAEQAADSAKYAAEADGGLADDARAAIVSAHDYVCVMKAKMARS